MRTWRCFLLSKEAAQGRSHAEDVEEVANRHDTGGRLRIAAAGETQIVGRREGFVASDILVDTAHGAELFKCVGRISGAREAARVGRRRDPHKLM